MAIEIVATVRAVVNEEYLEHVRVLDNHTRDEEILEAANALLAELQEDYEDGDPGPSGQVSVELTSVTDGDKVLV